MRRLLLVLVVTAAAGSVASAAPFTIFDAVQEAVRTNPGVGEAGANRRATDAELGQTQGTLLPQVRLEASAGPERLRRFITPAPVVGDGFNRGRQASVVVRQLLFDGFTSINEIWRQAARVDAASYRVHERTELIALDAAEAYIDVLRYTELVSLAETNVANHRRIFSNVRARFSGGRAGDGDLQQGTERLSSAEAVLADFRRSLEDARAKYRKVVGLEPFSLRRPGRLKGLPVSRDEALAVTLKHNPTLRAAGADRDAARHGFNATAGAFVPQVSFEGRAAVGTDSITYDGDRDEMSAKVVMSWDIFRGGQDSWRRKAAAERMIEQSMKQARLQREAFESVDKAWAARTITQERFAALSRDVEAGRRVVSAYGKEYELGQRSLLDLLTSENQYFNAVVAMVSTRSVSVFADFQLLAVMGRLLDYLKLPHPSEAQPLDAGTSLLVPVRLPPVLLAAPDIGPEPLKVDADAPLRVRAEASAASADAQPRVIVAEFGDRWPKRRGAVETLMSFGWLAPLIGGQHRTDDMSPAALPASSPTLSYASVEATMPFAPR